MSVFDTGFGQTLCDRFGQALNLVCSFMGDGGRILASSDHARVGNVHAIAARIMQGEFDEYRINAQEAAGCGVDRDSFIRAIDLNGHRVVVLAITGPLATIDPLARIVCFCVSSLLQVRQTHCTGSPITPHTLTHMLDQASASIGQSLLHLSDAVNHIEQGLVMFDRHQRLVVWNRRFLELADVSEPWVQSGITLAQLFRFNAERGEYGAGDVDRLVAERLASVQLRLPMRVDLERASGQIVEISGRPLPDGGFVSTYTDVSHRRQAERALRASEARFRSLTQLSADWFWEQDAHFRFTQVSGGQRFHPDQLGMDPIGHTRWELGYTCMDESAWAAHREQLQRHEPYRDMEFHHLDDAGVQRTLLISGEPFFDDAGRFGGYRGIGRDVTEQRRTHEALQIASLVYQTSSEAMIVVDANANIISVNPGFERATGYTAAEVLGHNPRILSSGHQDGAFYAAMWHSLNTTGHWQGELWNRRKNGALFLSQTVINTHYNADGSVHRRIGLFSDITRSKEAEQLIWSQANFDALTGLPNRSMFRDRLAQDIKKAHRAQRALALLSIDLDHFKEVNDALGHPAGDALLIEAARRVAACVRETDTVTRLGGDEFAVLLTDMDDSLSVERVALSVLRRLAEPFQTSEQAVVLSASIGITLYPGDALTVDDLLKSAEQAMYAAKKLGRNRYSYFTPDLQEGALKRLRLINDLRGAVTGGQLRVHFQPIMDLRAGRIHKAEALVRWQHPQRGLVSPGEFIPLAEETGLITDIGEWVFNESARWTQRWRRLYRPDFQVSVNKSPVQLRSDATHDDWVAQLAAIGLAGQGIVIEITEGVLLDSDSPTLAKLLSYRDGGMQIAIDDFGTGYSSLAYLKRFHIDYLKIDQSFTRNLAPGSSDLALSEAIIVMAHKLGLKVIAEGVETPEQRDLLYAAGCDYAQGYLFSRPVPPEAFEQLLMEVAPE